MEVTIKGIMKSDSTSTTNNENSTRAVNRTINIYRNENGTSTHIIKNNMNMVLKINIETKLSDMITTHRTCNGMGVANIVAFI